MVIFYQGFVYLCLLEQRPDNPITEMSQMVSAWLVIISPWQNAKKQIHEFFFKKALTNASERFARWSIIFSLHTHIHACTHTLLYIIWLKAHSDEKSFYWCHWPVFLPLPEQSCVLYFITSNWKTSIKHLISSITKQK